MEKLKSSWKRTHPRVRKPTVLIIGTCIILLAGAIGWMPGPGGIPLFLLGIAVLASEFVWAERVKTAILSVVYACGAWYRAHKLVGTFLLAAMAVTSLIITLKLLHVI